MDSLFPKIFTTILNSILNNSDSVLCTHFKGDLPRHKGEYDPYNSFWEIKNDSETLKAEFSNIPSILEPNNSNNTLITSLSIFVINNNDYSLLICEQGIILDQDSSAISLNNLDKEQLEMVLFGCEAFINNFIPELESFINNQLELNYDIENYKKIHDDFYSIKPDILSTCDKLTKNIANLIGQEIEKELSRELSEEIPIAIPFPQSPFFLRKRASDDDFNILALESEPDNNNLIYKTPSP